MGHINMCLSLGEVSGFNPYHMACKDLASLTVIEPRPQK